MNVIDVVADGLDERRLLHDQPVGQLDQHLGTAGLGRMYAAVGPVDRLAGLDQLARLLVRDLARIAELGEDVLVLVEVLDGGLVGDRQDDLVAALLGLPDLPEFGARAKPWRALRNSGRCPWHKSIRRACRECVRGISSGDGTVSEAGMWSTSSVVIRGSCRYSLMSLVYSSSIFCGAAAGADATLPFRPCASPGAETRSSSAPTQIADRTFIATNLRRVLKLIPLSAAACQPIMTASKSPVSCKRYHAREPTAPIVL